MAQFPQLKKGAHGEAVKGLQNGLNRWFGPLAVDGDFGAGTEGAVRQFQSGAGLEADGIVGPKTWLSLNVHLVESGDTLSGIAEQYLGDASRWPEILHLNTALVSDPDKIHPGQILALP